MILQKLRLAKNGAAVNQGSKRLFFSGMDPGKLTPKQQIFSPEHYLTLSDVI